MKQTHTLTVDQSLVRFTPKGKIFIIDAIGLLCSSDQAEDIWKRLVAENPHIAENCEYYRFKEERLAPVADSKSWEKIENLLFDYVIETSM